MARDDVLFCECLRDFNRAERTDIAVIVSAFGNTVDVRAEENWLEIVIAAGPAPNQVSGSVDIYVEFRGAHQAHHVLASAGVGFAVRETADTALRIPAKLRERVDMRYESRPI